MNSMIIVKEKKKKNYIKSHKNHKKVKRRNIKINHYHVNKIQ